jgi:probable phosphoglycerate mutase
VIRLILWRHGRTDWNHTHRSQGQLDSELDEVGLAQAAAAAPVLAAMQPSLIVSSDLRRTTRTAGFLADLTGLPLDLDRRLRERHFGRWQGLTLAEIEQNHPDEWAATQRGEHDQDGVEPLASLGERAGSALVDIAGRLGESGVAVVVTHGGAARAAAGTLLELPLARWHMLGALGNCAISDLRRHPSRGWFLHAHNVAPPG